MSTFSQLSLSISEPPLLSSPLLSSPLVSFPFLSSHTPSHRPSQSLSLALALALALPSQSVCRSGGGDFLPILASASSHWNLTTASKATSGNDAKENEDGVSLGTMKLPLDIDIPRFKSLLFQFCYSWLLLAFGIPLLITLIVLVVSLCNKVYAQEIEDDKAIDHHELIDEENLQLNSATAGRMYTICRNFFYLMPFFGAILCGELSFHIPESTPPTCASNLETIFGESNEVHSEPEINNDAADDSDDNSRSSSEYHTCNVSDFYISDMIAAGLPIEGNSIYDDITEVSCLLDYKCDEPTTFFDVAEKYMILPFLEDTMEASGNHDGKTCEDTIIDSDDSSLYLAIHQLRSYNEEPDVNPYSDSDQLECFDPHKFFRNLPGLLDVAPKFHPTTLLNES
ncbi:hypothetical protein LOK49_LG08G02737 [Camellia lanceoleosa]|uniref:Uncharacterized protein n=1 Tax=Camellia lanceoleosa TaxID=1840588 RepID=A0ACC0GRV1_9ERIC|nr:hypothetical protein LOK49_LG08G02737 [Camellia lanceoleosa]